jgi:hypothetical protein
VTDNQAAIECFLNTDPEDVGCGQVMGSLHVYVDMVIAGRDEVGRYRGVAVHLAACSACGEDYHGLLRAVTETP